MYLYESIKYSNPVFSASGSLIQVDLEQDGRVVRFGSTSNYNEAELWYSSVDEEQRVATYIDELFDEGYDYLTAISEREHSYAEEKAGYYTLTDEDKKRLDANVVYFKPNYDVLVSLLGSEERVNLVYDQKSERRVLKGNSHLPEHVFEELLNHNTW